MCWCAGVCAWEHIAYRCGDGAAWSNGYYPPPQASHYEHATLLELIRTDHKVWGGEGRGGEERGGEGRGGGGYVCTVTVHVSCHTHMVGFVPVHA